MDCSASLDGDFCCLHAGKWRPVGGNRFGLHNVLDEKLGVIVEFRCQIEALVTWAIALSWQPDEDDAFLCGLRWIGLQLLDQRMLRQLFAGRWSVACTVCHLSLLKIRNKPRELADDITLLLK
jgi:hypothetical protein